MTETFDAIVVGASIAGCTAATLLGRRGLRVALLERATDPAAYKKTCTHYIQPCATRTIERLGLAERLGTVGAVRNPVDLCTPFGWIIGGDLGVDGYNVRRQTLDPMVRELAAQTPGVSLRLGHSVKDLVREGARVAGVRVSDRDGQESELRAPLVVAADGRHSKLGELAGVPAKTAANGRFLYAAYYRLPAASSKSMLWLLNPDVCYVFPNDGGVACVVTMPTKDRLPAFRADLEGSFKKMFAALPRAPKLDLAERVSDFYGMLDIPNHIRRASAPGIAFVGDAAMTSDPVMGVGVGWAFQTAEWLADDVADALTDKRGLRDLDTALDVYARHHADRLHAHHDMLNDMSQAKPLNPIERLLFGAAVKDAEVARTMGMLSARLTHPKEVMGPKLLARAVWANLTKKVQVPVAEPPRAALV
jgi:2-polyprenyl-6-methoxyphenol hydroxylase-like FAD-dependent oxidoreductase